MPDFLFYGNFFKIAFNNFSWRLPDCSTILEVSCVASRVCLSVAFGGLTFVLFPNGASIPASPIPIPLTNALALSLGDELPIEEKASFIAVAPLFIEPTKAFPASLKTFLGSR